MSTKTCFHGEIRKISLLLVEKGVLYGAVLLTTLTLCPYIPKSLNGFTAINISPTYV